MIADANIRDDLDAEQINYRPKRSRKAPVQLQEDSLGLFSPETEFNNKMTFYSWNISEKNTWHKLTVPTKLPQHLALTAMLVDKKSDENFKYTSDQVINAVNRNQREVDVLV